MDRVKFKCQDVVHMGGNAQNVFVLQIRGNVLHLWSWKMEGKKNVEKPMVKRSLLKVLEMSQEMDEVSWEETSGTM